MTINRENKERLRIGRELANRLTPKKSPVEVAKQLGISTWRLRQIECIALWKIQQRLKELAGHEAECLSDSGSTTTEYCFPKRPTPHHE